MYLLVRDKQTANNLALYTPYIYVIYDKDQDIILYLGRESVKKSYAGIPTATRCHWSQHSFNTLVYLLSRNGYSSAWSDASLQSAHDGLCIPNPLSSSESRYILVWQRLPTLLQFTDIPTMLPLIRLLHPCVPSTEHLQEIEQHGTPCTIYKLLEYSLYSIAITMTSM